MIQIKLTSETMGLFTMERLKEILESGINADCDLQFELNPACFKLTRNKDWVQVSYSENDNIKSIRICRDGKIKTEGVTMTLGMMSALLNPLRCCLTCGVWWMGKCGLTGEKTVSVETCKIKSAHRLRKEFTR